MADLADVENALVNAISAALYPGGTLQPSVLGCDCRVYRGWPVAAKLDADLRAGALNVSVYAQPNVERNTTRFLAEWKTMTPPSPKVTLGVAGNVVTVGGAVQAGDVATVKIGGRQAYSVAVQANATLASVAAALLTLVQADYQGASVNGAAITIPTGNVISATVGGQGTSWRELRRQKKGFQVVIWASTPAQRDAASKAIDTSLAKVELAGFLAFADGGCGWFSYEMTRENDAPQKELLYRRDLFYSVDYPTSETETDTSITAVQENVKGGASPPDAPQVTSII